MAGVHLLKVKELMGHKTIQLTARYDAHLSPKELLEAVEKLVPEPSATTGAPPRREQRFPIIFELSIKCLVSNVLSVVWACSSAVRAGDS